jgi:hypothetical protein
MLTNVKGTSFSQHQRPSKPQGYPLGPCTRSKYSLPRRNLFPREAPVGRRSQSTQGKEAASMLLDPASPHDLTGNMWQLLHPLDTGSAMTLIARRIENRHLEKDCTRSIHSPDHLHAPEAVDTSSPQLHHDRNANPSRSPTQESNRRSESQILFRERRIHQGRAVSHHAVVERNHSRK